MSDLKDLKEGLSSARKADITQVRTPFLVYTARPCEYGNVRYERANYMRPVNPLGHTGVPVGEDFDRLTKYLRAAASHINQVLDAMELHRSQDPQLLDTEGMKTACFAIDTDVPPHPIGPSFLPHIAPACASLNMAITQAVMCGLLPADPGTPWVAAAPVTKPLPALRDHPIAEAMRRARAELTELRTSLGPSFLERHVVGGVAADLCPGESDLLVPVPGADERDVISAANHVRMLVTDRHATVVTTGDAKENARLVPVVTSVSGDAKENARLDALYLENLMKEGHG